MTTLLCIKCKDEALKIVDENFYRCGKCERQFRVADSGELVDRWMSPISIVLYPVIFSARPVEDAQRVAEGLYESTIPGSNSIFMEFSLEQIQYLITDINDELSTPTQKVSAILDCKASEEDVRKYLGKVVNTLCSILEKNN